MIASAMEATVRACFSRCRCSSLAVGREPAKRFASSPSSLKQDVEAISEYKTYKANVDIDGKGLFLETTQASFDKEASSNFTPTRYSFAAPWLWVNDPRHVHPSSGQKLRTLGQYCTKEHALQEAAVLRLEEDNPAVLFDDELGKVFRTPDDLHPIASPGSFHSRGGVYVHPDDNQVGNNDDDAVRRTLLRLSWANGEESYFDLNWLTKLAPVVEECQHGQAQARSETEVTPNMAIGASSNVSAVPIPSMDYNAILANGEMGRLQALHSIVEHGALLVTGAPIVWDDVTSLSDTKSHNGMLESDSTVVDLAKSLSGGRLSHGSLYGDTFRVQSEPGAKNIAYTTVALPPHQDLTYYESKPFLQLLHCVSQPRTVGDETGASILIDAMAACHFLRQEAPDLFEILTTVEATFVKQREGADMVAFKPHIVLSHTTGEVIQVNWSPPFEGPFRFGKRSLTTPSGKRVTMEDYVRAYQAMELLLDDRHPKETASLLASDLQATLQRYAKDYTWEYTLQPGDLLVFNNQRMCHGRRAFQLDELDTNSTRHLIGCYTDAMETINTYRLLLRYHTTSGETRNLSSRIRIPNVGMGSRGSPSF